MTFSTFQSKSSTWRVRGEAPYQVHALETLVRIQYPLETHVQSLRVARLGLKLICTQFLVCTQKL